MSRALTMSFDANVPGGVGHQIKPLRSLGSDNFENE